MTGTRSDWPPGGKLPRVEEPQDDSAPPPSVLAQLLDTASQDAPIFESTEDLFARDKMESAVRRKITTMLGRIAEYWPKLPDDVHKIIERIANEEQAPTDQVAAEWLVQRMLFLEIGRHFDLQRVDRFSRSRVDCFLALTERASLITGGGPDRKGERPIEYIRIPSRAGSWKEAVSATGPIETIRRGHRARLPGMRTSPVQYILVIPAARANEFSRIANVTRTGMRSTFVGKL
jgi:hypothetical protein